MLPKVLDWPAPRARFWWQVRSRPALLVANPAVFKPLVDRSSRRASDRNGWLVPNRFDTCQRTARGLYDGPISQRGPDS